MSDLIDSEIDRFLAQKAAEPVQRGRLIFALDATLSRQPTWDIACQLQAEMFREVAGIGSLDVQLVYFRGPEGHPEGECRASRWYDSPAYLHKAMSSITCRAGIRKSGGFCSTAVRKPYVPKSALWCLSVMPARKLQIPLLSSPPISAGSMCRCSCSKRVTNGKWSRCSVISRD